MFALLDVAPRFSSMETSDRDLARRAKQGLDAAISVGDRSSSRVPMLHTRYSSYLHGNSVSSVINTTYTLKTYRIIWTAGLSLCHCGDKVERTQSWSSDKSADPSLQPHAMDSATASRAFVTTLLAGQWPNFKLHCGLGHASRLVTSQRAYETFAHTPIPASLRSKWRSNFKAVGSCSSRMTQVTWVHLDRFLTGPCVWIWR